MKKLLILMFIAALLFGGISVSAATISDVPTTNVIKDPGGGGR